MFKNDSKNIYIQGMDFTDIEASVYALEQAGLKNVEVLDAKEEIEGKIDKKL